MNDSNETSDQKPAFTRHETLLLAVLGLLGWHFSDFQKRGLGWQIRLWRGEAPPEAAHCKRSELRAFTLRQLRAATISGKKRNLQPAKK